MVASLGFLNQPHGSIPGAIFDQNAGPALGPNLVPVFGPTFRFAYRFVLKTAAEVPKMGPRNGAHFSLQFAPFWFPKWADFEHGFYALGYRSLQVETPAAVEV